MRIRAYFSFSVVVLAISILISYFLIFGYYEEPYFPYQRINSYEMDISKSIEISSINGAITGASLYLISSYPNIDIERLNKAASIGALVAVEAMYYNIEEEAAIFCGGNMESKEMLEEETLVIPVDSKHFSLINCRNTIKANVFIKGDSLEEILDNSSISLSISNPSLENGQIGISIYDRENNIAKVIFMENRVVSSPLSGESMLKEDIEKALINEGIIIPNP